MAPSRAGYKLNSAAIGLGSYHHAMSTYGKEKEGEKFTLVHKLRGGGYILYIGGEKTWICGQKGLNMNVFCYILGKLYIVLISAPI